jgi:hypothetical protein
MSLKAYVERALLPAAFDGDLAFDLILLWIGTSRQFTSLETGAFGTCLNDPIDRFTL